MVTAGYLTLAALLVPLTLMLMGNQVQALTVELHLSHVALVMDSGEMESISLVQQINV